MAFSLLNGYVSDIKNGYYLKVSEKHVELFYYHNLEYTSDIKSLVFDLVNKKCVCSKRLGETPITDFINGNQEIYDNIEKNILHRFKLTLIEEYQYLNGWNHTYNDRHNIYIKDNIITSERDGNVIKDDIHKFYFIPKGFFGSREDVLYIRDGEFSQHNISKIYNYIIDFSLIDSLLKHYYKQRKILNRKKVIDEIID